MKKIDDGWGKEYDKLDKIDVKNFDKKKVFGKFMNEKVYPYQLNILNKEIDLNNLSVLEIGGGYGGFCELVLEKYQIKKYTMLDHPSMLRFAKEYLKKYNVEFVDIYNIEKILNNSYDVLVSISCLSETTEEYRKYIFDNVFRVCKKVFVIDTNDPVFKNQMYDSVKDTFKLRSYEYSREMNNIRIYIGVL